MSEIFARKLKKKLIESNLKFSNLNTDAIYIHNEMNKKLENEQIKYDNETNHGTILSQQKNGITILNQNYTNILP